MSAFSHKNILVRIAIEGPPFSHAVATTTGIGICKAQGLLLYSSKLLISVFYHS